ncbi:MAG: DUF3000 domain-containing protein [Demequinaceae bacterium]|nr:DUF3000 domain-containing protein [Demequinaceae bacterium]
MAPSYPRRVTPDPSEVPQAFREVLRSLRRADVRGDVVLVEAPAPSRIAPYAVALDGEIIVDGNAAASGRFVVLHDPDGQEAWNGTIRVVALVKAEVEPEVGTDELWGQVAWSWIDEALSDTPHEALGGTVTRVTNEAFGDLKERGRTVIVEMRISWTPLETDMTSHLKAWAHLLASCAGVPPLPDGVTMLPGKAS